MFVYLAIALGFSFLCSVLEAILLSVTPSYINIKIQDGKKAGEDLKMLKDDIDRPLSAILTLNTFAHTAGAAGVGAQAQLIWGVEYLTLVSIILTLLILFLSEIIPKTIGAMYWRTLAPFAAPLTKILVYTLYPAVWVSQLVTKLIKRDEKKSVLSRADFRAIAEIGIKDGVFRDSESAIIRNLLNFNSILVKNIMTPRTVVLAADEEMSIQAFHKNHQDLRFSRIPVYKNTIDSVTGFVLKDEILLNMINHNGEKPLRDIKRKIEIVPEVVSIPELFKLLVDKNVHIAMVVDEYGGMAGIVTMEDIIETLLGLEITDEYDSVDDLQALARENWEKRARRLGLLDK